MRCGTRGSSSAPSAPARASTVSRSPLFAPTGTTGLAQSRSAFRDRLEDDLARRDFTVNAMAVRITPTGRANSLTHWAVWRRCGPESWTLRRLRRSRSPTIRCGCCALRGSSPSWASLSRRECGRPSKTWPAAGPHHCRAGGRRIGQAIARPRPVAGIDLMVQTGMGEVVLPEVGAMRMAIDEHHQHKDVYQHSLKVLQQAIDLEDGPPTWYCAGRRCCTTSASPPLAGTRPTAG
ncbi:poly A polymerase head domain protein [Mycobacterium xenopi 3993]|nr:poly A polymerase head domain protein [Mycobacterium xenopi 3993]